jgi:hypothetical protein
MWDDLDMGGLPRTTEYPLFEILCLIGIAFFLIRFIVKMCRMKKK